MSTVGPQVNLNTLNNKLSDVILRTRSVVEDARQLRIWLNNQTDAELEGLGVSAPDDLYLLRVGVQDLGTFSDLWFGEATLANAHDFRLYTDQLTGIE
jgi:hypothetical protein